MKRRLFEFLRDHRRVGVGLVLSIGMVALLLWFSRGQELLLTQRLAMLLATVATAGLSAYITVDKQD